MNSLFSIYLASGVFFLLIEMLTATFYGLSVSISFFVLALYVSVTGDAQMTITQALILVAVSAMLAYFFPKWLKPRSDGFKSGLDAYVGKTFRLERVGDDWKVKIDGVDYLVDESSVTGDFEAGKKVRIDAYESGILKVSVVQ